MQAQPSDSPTPHQPGHIQQHSPENHEISRESLVEIAKDIAAQLESVECCGINQGDVLRHLDNENLSQTSDLHPRRLARRIPQYAADFEAHFKDNSTATNVVGRFFEKRSMFKEFVGHREEFLKDAVRALDENHLIRRDVQIAIGSGHWGMGPVTAAVEFINITRLGKEVLHQLEKPEEIH